MSDLQKGLKAFETQNYPQALQLLKPLAEQNNAQAQCILGNMYHLGLGVERNLEEAIIWYLKSAQQGHAIAANNLGSIYLVGDEGIEKNLTKAEQWFQKAREQGFINTPSSNNYLSTVASS